MADPIEELFRAWQGSNPQQRQVLEQRYAREIQQRPDETAWNHAWRRGLRLTPNTLEELVNRRRAVTPGENSALGFASRILEGLNASPNSRTAENKRSVELRAPIAPMPAPNAGSGGFGAAATPARAAAAPVRLTGSQTAEQHLKLIFPNAVVTGRDRTPERNRAVNGSETSHHLRQNAIDVRPIPGVTFQQFVQSYRDAGYEVLEALDETGGRTKGTGPHWHIAVAPKTAPTLTQQARAAGAGLYDSVDPKLVMGMIPDPVLQQYVNLPDAPQMEYLPDRAPLEAPDAQTLLAELRAVSQIPERDRKGDNWERFQALLGGMAAGSANADPYGGVGQLLAAMGSSGIGAFAGERESQRAQDLAIQEQQRALNIALAKAGIDVNLGALDTRNQNLDRDWTNRAGRVEVDNTNAASAFENIVREQLLNSNIQGNNAGVINQTGMARAQAGIGAVESGVAARNSGTETALGLMTQGGNENPLKAVENDLVRLGITPTEEVLTAGVALRGGNPAGALPSLAKEVLATGIYAQYLAPDDVKELQRFMQQGDDGMPQALALVQQALAADYNAAAGTPGNEDMRKLIALLANQGQPTARLIQGASQ